MTDKATAQKADDIVYWLTDDNDLCRCYSMVIKNNHKHLTNSKLGEPHGVIEP